MSSTRQQPSASHQTGWVGWIVFAAIMMVIVGSFNIIDGLVALFKDEVFVTTTKGIFLFDITAWGWIHLILGVLQILVGLALLRGAFWARITAVVLVTVNAIEQLAFLGAYPLWSTIIIALDIIVIWAIVVHGEEARTL